MIIDISDSEFKKILEDERLHLPIRWDGSDFTKTLENLFSNYIRKLESVSQIERYGRHIHLDVNNVKSVCGFLQRAVKYYLNGYPAKAYETFESYMYKFMETNFSIYNGVGKKQFENDDLRLFRVAKVNDNRPYKRERLFHTPYNSRSKVSTSRYSIAGFPSLYLGTILELCCNEIHVNPQQDFVLASMFKIEKNTCYTNTNIKIIDLGIKPQDFLYENEEENLLRGRRLDMYSQSSSLDDSEIKAKYLLIYPLIAACSFIRTNKDDPFAAEYIIPQLLMQWVRSEFRLNDEYDIDELVGIRYFSCASVKSSEKGFNYVFPTSGECIAPDLPYCPILAKTLRLTQPVYIHEYDTVEKCEYYLRKINVFDMIKNE